jgi:hypothetical protein
MAQLWIAGEQVNGVWVESHVNIILMYLFYFQPEITCPLYNPTKCGDSF